MYSYMHLQVFFSFKCFKAKPAWHVCPNISVSGNLPGRKFVRAEIYQGGILPGRKFTRTEISQGIYFWRRIFISAQYKLITIFTKEFTPSYFDSIAFKVIFVHQIKSFQVTSMKQPNCRVVYYIDFRFRISYLGLKVLISDFRQISDFGL